MTKGKTESFMRGALMLSLAALISRLLGALYKPAVARIFAPFDGHSGEIGIALTQVPLTTYQVIFSFTSVGLNVGISRLVAEAMALGDVRGARRVFRVSLTMMAVLGLISSFALWFGAPWIVKLIGKEAVETIPGFRATAPALLITSVMAAYRGLFQGFQQMTPNAYSQIIEQVVRVSSGLVLTYILVQKSVPMGAAGFNMGDVLGAVVALGYLLLLVRKAGGGLWEPGVAATAEPPSAAGTAETPWLLVKRIFAVAAPIAIAGAVVPIMMWSDTFFVFRSLAHTGMEGGDIQAQYGRLTNVFMIASLPAVFTTAIYTSILPAITKAMALNQVAEARRKAGQAYRVTMLMAIPAQAGLFALAAGVYALLFRQSAGGVVMAAMSWAVFPIMLQQTTSGVLQGIGRIVLPVRNFVVGALVKAALTPWWTMLWGINGAAYATAVGFLLAASLNVYYVEKLLGRTFKTRSMLFKPAAASLVMVGVIELARKTLAAKPTHPTVVTLALIVVGGGVYGVVMLLIGGIKREELTLVPGVGRPLAGLLERVGLLR
ncbi:MAG TPA: polysaccharide biosynthesis protein [Symbiobacteriaceae bacterium]